MGRRDRRLRSSTGYGTTSRLFLSEETVKSHVRHLLAKLQARSRAHAVSMGFQRGLLI